MSVAASNLDPAGLQSALAALQAARAAGKVSASAADNIRDWLTQSHFAEYTPLVLEHIAAGKWPDLDDAFWTTIPFGTAGRRGRMYPIGTSTINDRTIGESAQGLADYVLAYHRAPAITALRCAIAYDTRHRSRHFAQLCAEIMVAAGFDVLFFDDFRPTPELSFAVRDRQCACGIMISASHNPPSDNAIKAFWSTGGQLRPPHDAGVTACVQRVTAIRRVSFAEGRAAGRITFCQDQIDPKYQAAVLSAGQLPVTKVKEPGTNDNLQILYSPLHGVGLTSVLPILKSAGFSNVEVFGPHAAPDGDFPNVPGHVANPENPAVFDALIQHGRARAADLVVASDPDADRIGCAAPLKADSSTSHSPAPWQTLSGNQIGALLADFLLRRLQATGRLTPEHYLIKTLVTSDMVCRIAEHFGIRAYGDVLTGFKWIGSLIDEVGPEEFVFGFEEAHGYLAGTYARDKDAAIAALLLAQLAADCKAQGRTLHDQLDRLFVQYGCHQERTISHTMPGADGLARMKSVLDRLRANPPRQLGDLPVRQVRDYLLKRVTVPPLSLGEGWGEGAGTADPFQNLPPTDLLIFDLDPPHNRAAVRPSGTEPKLKFYLFAYDPPGSPADLPTTKLRLQARLEALESALLSAAGG